MSAWETMVEQTGFHRSVGWRAAGVRHPVDSQATPQSGRLGAARAGTDEFPEPRVLVESAVIAESSSMSTAEAPGLLGPILLDSLDLTDLCPCDSLIMLILVMGARPSDGYSFLFLGNGQNGLSRSPRSGAGTQGWDERHELPRPRHNSGPVSAVAPGAAHIVRAFNRLCAKWLRPISTSWQLTCLFPHRAPGTIASTQRFASAPGQA